MIQDGTIVKVCDKTGVVLGICIKVLGHAKKRIAILGDVIIISVRRINPKKFHKVKLFRRKKFFKGTMHRALVVRTRVNYSRVPGLFICFSENSVVIVNKRIVPVSNRVYGPVIRELCMRLPSLGCITRVMI
jgi:large subunit ribosomal protein L14